MLSRSGNKCLFALGVGGIGLISAGTFIGLAAAGHDVAAMSVGSSKLAMVVAISGTALFLISFLTAYRLAPQDKLKFTPKVLKLNTEWYGRISNIGYKDNWQVLAGIIGISTVMAYVGVHHGISSLFANMSFGPSISIQAISGFAIGAIMMVGLGLIAIGWRRLPREAFAVEAMAFGTLIAGATVVGPILAHIMGDMATNNAEAIALEAIIAISIASLFLVVEEAVSCALSAGIFPEHLVVIGEDGVSYQRIPITEIV
ncbi:MAG: hypothetical protein JSS50_02410 [Proteobacteria bacterium]|nr:hypothetical protein [Pseudomonadota bacterium]